MTTWLHRILAPRRGRTTPADPEALTAARTARDERDLSHELLAQARQAGRFQRATRHENNFGHHLDHLLRGTT